MQVTGLLLHSDSQYVQMPEGAQDTVRAIYAKISQNPRHLRVAVASKDLLPAQQFAEWSMDFGFAAMLESEQAGSPLAQPATLPGLSTTSAHPKVLMEAFIG